MGLTRDRYGHVLELNFTLIDLLAYEVVLYIYMLCSGMELGFLASAIAP
jgi:hypothetical protein